MWEGELNEVEVELQLSQKCRFIRRATLLVLINDSGYFVVEKRLLVERSLRDCLLDDGYDLLDIGLQTHLS